VKNRLMHSILKIIKGVVIDLPRPKKIKGLWKFGSLLGLFLGVQLVTGIFLSFRYIRSVESAYGSVDLLMRDVLLGSFVRIFHSKGATFFFLFLYIHMFRGIYYYSYRYREVWLIGCVIFVLSMAVAFLGYVLPWGQMSFWGATVITNLFSAIPYVGKNIVIWLWGGFSISFPTLIRFFSFHFVIPFVLVFFIVLHIFFLHETGRKNPLGLNRKNVKIFFKPYFSINDFMGFMMVICLFIIMRFGFPYLFMDVENFIEAKFLVTPVHIQPEWYFLAAYAILRSIPKKLGGVLALVMFILMFFLLPFVRLRISILWKYLFQFLFFVWVLNFIILLWIGARSVEVPYILIGRISCFIYFFLFLFF